MIILVFFKLINISQNIFSEDLLLYMAIFVWAKEQGLNNLLAAKPVQAWYCYTSTQGIEVNKLMFLTLK